MKILSLLSDLALITFAVTAGAHAHLQTLVPSARYSADTINVGPGQRYDVIWKARQPGKWLIHCHIGHHTTNNNVETQGGGAKLPPQRVDEMFRQMTTEGFLPSYSRKPSSPTHSLR